jgi:hypothetical protein
MKLFRWYSEKLHMGGITAHTTNTTREEVINEVYNYIIDAFDDMKFAPQQYTLAGLMISIWPIELDDDYNECYPNTIATHY